MADTIKLVRGDNRPYIRLTLTQADGSPLDLSSSGCTVTIYFRSVNDETVLKTISVQKVGTGSTGMVMFNFPGTALDVPPGIYEGEVEINFDGEKQTLYERLKFFVRDQIG